MSTSQRVMAVSNDLKKNEGIGDTGPFHFAMSRSIQLFARNESCGQIHANFRLGRISGMVTKENQAIS